MQRPAPNWSARSRSSPWHCRSAAGADLKVKEPRQRARGGLIFSTTILSSLPMMDRSANSRPVAVVGL